jgi:hypothetical protein
MSRSYFISTLTYHDDATQIIWFWCDCCRYGRREVFGWLMERKEVHYRLFVEPGEKQASAVYTTIWHREGARGRRWETEAPTKCQAQNKSNKQTNKHMNWRLIQTIVHNFACGFQILPRILLSLSEKSIGKGCDLRPVFFVQRTGESQPIVARPDFRLLGFNFWPHKDGKKFPTHSHDLQVEIVLCAQFLFSVAFLEPYGNCQTW